MHIPVVEDEFLIVQQLSGIISNLGDTVIGALSDIAEGMGSLTIADSDTAILGTWGIPPIWSARPDATDPGRLSRRQGQHLWPELSHRAAGTGLGLCHVGGFCPTEGILHPLSVSDLEGTARVPGRAGDC